MENISHPKELENHLLSLFVKVVPSMKELSIQDTNQGLTIDQRPKNLIINIHNSKDLTIVIQIPPYLM